ncbi:ABC transporter permease [Halostella sp. JP-L12]|uniref:ABC transporter permease n=1 Tax=Halostella TaxID=1843185 RepID=UPI000EF83930|nr:MULTISPECIES: ABC transporter permease [Halostella]NHN48040.1 ABC transporter permease [Halostella sp. JP-L12]
MASEHKTGDGVVSRRASLFRRLREHRWTGLLVNVAPSGFWLVAFFLAPLAVTFYYSLGRSGAFGVMHLGLSDLGLQQYAKLLVPEGASGIEAVWISLAWMLEGLIPLDIELTTAQPTAFMRLTVKSVLIGAVATLVSFLVGYPTAYYIGRIAPERYRNLLLVLVILPFWASFLVRIYAIQLILTADNLLTDLMHLIAQALAWLPLFTYNGNLMNSRFAVMLGLVYIWIPFMILPVYASIEEIDFTLQEAAMDLGADRWQAFRKVVFPLSKPGVMAGTILVFIPSAGAYVIPALLGGPDSQMVGNFIADRFNKGDWPLGSAASFVLMAVMLLAIAAYQRYSEGGELA